MEIRRARSEDLVPHELAAETAVSIVGLGAIGSNAAYLLSKMGIGKIVGYDDDEVEDLNIEPQIYNLESCGFPKVAAVAGFLQDDTYYWPHAERWTSETNVLSPIVISGVDSMGSRREIATSLRNSKNWTHYIDGRMGGNLVEVYHVVPETLRGYWKYNVVAVEPMNIPCSRRAVAYNGMVCASIISRMVAAILNNEPVPDYIKLDLLAWGFDVGPLHR